MSPKQLSQLCQTQNIQLPLNLFPALTALRELARHSPICWRRTQSHSLLISPWPCLWPPDSPCGHKTSLRYCQVWLCSCRVIRSDWKSTLTIFSQRGQKLLWCHLWWFQDLDLRRRRGSDLRRTNIYTVRHTSSTVTMPLSTTGTFNIYTEEELREEGRSRVHVILSIFEENFNRITEKLQKLWKNTQFR